MMRARILLAAIALSSLLALSAARADTPASGRGSRANPYGTVKDDERGGARERADRGGSARDTPCFDDSRDEERTAARANKVVDLNTAETSDLLALPGIGPARARAILDYRIVHGGFRSVSQLLQIRGIGRALLKQLRPLVTLSMPPPRPPGAPE